MTHICARATCDDPELDRSDALARAMRVLGEPNRLNMLYGMGPQCQSVSAIVASTGMTQTNVSFHLRALREAGLVRAERRGPFVYYCLADPDLLRILNELKSWLDAHSSGAAHKSGAPGRASLTEAIAACCRFTGES